MTDEHNHQHDNVRLPASGYGPAITSVDESEDGELWVSNDEYASQVNYCPVCGHEAEVKVDD